MLSHPCPSQTKLSSRTTVRQFLEKKRIYHFPRCHIGVSRTQLDYSHEFVYVALEHFTQQPSGQVQPCTPLGRPSELGGGGQTTSSVSSQTSAEKTTLRFSAIIPGVFSRHHAAAEGCARSSKVTATARFTT